MWSYRDERDDIPVPEAIHLIKTRIDRLESDRKKLLTKLKEIRDILRFQPAPKLGEWNWPEIIKHIEIVIAEVGG